MPFSARVVAGDNVVIVSLHDSNKDLISLETTLQPNKLYWVNISIWGHKADKNSLVIVAQV